MADLRRHITVSDQRFERIEMDIRDLFKRSSGEKIPSTYLNRTQLIDGSHYFFSVRQLSQAGALKYCREMAGTLLTLGNNGASLNKVNIFSLPAMFQINCVGPQRLKLKVRYLQAAFWRSRSLR